MRIVSPETLIRYLGWRWAAFRLRHGWRRWSGYFVRRSPARGWDEIPWREWCADESLIDPGTFLEWRRGKAPPFLFSAGDFPGWRERLNGFDQAIGDSHPREQADRIASGTFPHYSVHWLERGSDPEWHANPFTGERADAHSHWSQIADNGFGDIKHIWELSRFAWVYPLVRAYARDGDPRHAETFWKLLESWLEKNPPNTGVNWMCGQETSIRLMAWCVGLYGFIDTEATTPERMCRLASAVAESARRVEANLGYALSQKNNHGITECSGLITVGVLFPEIRGSERWKAIGLANLRRQVNELVYRDGAFSQHSPNYERLALQALIWVHQLMVRNRFESDGWLRNAIARGGRFLFEICESGTGAVPNSGGNDGALLLPLNNCAYEDFRPVIQTAFACAHGARAFEAGAWDEDLFWLGIDAPAQTRRQTPATAFDAPDGGLYTLRQDDWTVVAHAPTFRHRPAHADLLHVDLWWRGRAVVVDAGTYGYRAEPPFEDAFKTTRFHNTVEVDGISQMEPVSRFLLLPWANGRLVQRGETKPGGARWMVLESEAYQRLKDPVSHQRAVIAGTTFVAVIDRLSGTTGHRCRLHWLFDPHWAEDLERNNGDLTFEFWSSLDGSGKSIIAGDPVTARGWRSRHYAEREPAPSVVLEGAGNEALFLTLFAERPVEWEYNETEQCLRIESLSVRTGGGSLSIG